jgi:polyisoprenoid-binding protein YceI
MKKFTLFILLALTCAIANAQYKPAAKGSSVGFTIANFGFDVKGSFSGLQGTINFDSKTPVTGNMDITIDASSVNTDNDLRDKHLRDENYFDVKNYPTIHFVSAKITPVKGDNYVATGQLTIKGKSKNINIPFTATAVNDEYLFKGSFKINRKDFGIGGTSTIANELEVFLTVATIKPDKGV